MSQASSNFNPSVPNSQTPDASPTQLNTQDPMTWPPCERCGNPAPLKTQYGDLCESCYEAATAERQRLVVYCTSDDDLCQMIAGNSGRNGDKDLAHLATQELERRGDLQKAIDALATVKSRRRFLQGMLAVSLALAAPKPAMAESQTESDFEQRKPAYPDPLRQAVVGRWLAVIDSTLVHVESFWSYLEDCNEVAPAEVDDQRLYHLMNEAHNAANELCSLLESGDSVYNLDELLSVTTGKPLGYIFLREEILRGDMDPDRARLEVEAYTEDYPQYRAELESLLAKAVNNDS